MSDYDVLVVGRSCVDHIAVVGTFPRENTKVALKQRLVEGGARVERPLPASRAWADAFAMSAVWGMTTLAGFA